jgi:hypothetical protein
MQVEPKPPFAVMMEFIGAPWIAQSIYVVAKLGVADKIAAGTKDAKALAEACGVDADALGRVLRALAVPGITKDLGDGRYELTEVGQTLRGDVPGSVRAMAIMFGEDFHWRPVGALLHSVKTGKPGFDQVFGTDAWTHWQKHPDQAAIFNDAMTEFSKSGAQAIVGAYDFSKLERLVDVGGGHGLLLAEVLRAAPKLAGVLFDQPDVVKGAAAVLPKDVSGRVQVVGGDFLESVPAGGDAYMMKHIIHDWDDERCIRILSNVRKVIPKDGTLLVHEMVVPPAGVPHFAKLLDLEMLLMTQGGRERTEPEFAALFSRAGFKLTRVVPTRSPLSIVEGKPA